jgi:secreted PhoX family phosphatase
VSLTRRSFLRRAAAASAGWVVPGALEALAARAAVAATPKALAAVGYGPLVPDPNGLLDLPEGFRYRALSMGQLGTTSDARFSQRMTFGEWVPALHDGMAAFAGAAGMTILVRNHECEPGHSPAVAPGKTPRYDALGTGGTTTLWVDADRNLVRSFASLAGTFRNCAGGRTPWGSWLTCEECTYLPGALDPHVHDLRPDVGERHGYVFEVDARAEGLVEPVPIKAMGRFYHEAVAVDPATGFVYLTEDRDDGLLYRRSARTNSKSETWPRAERLRRCASWTSPRRGPRTGRTRARRSPSARASSWTGCPSRTSIPTATWSAIQTTRSPIR